MYGPVGSASDSAGNLGQFGPLDQIGIYFMRLPILNLEDCDFKLQNQSRDANVVSKSY